MKLQVDLNEMNPESEAYEDVEFQMEFDPPPEFGNQEQAKEWALTNLPKNTPFTIYSANGRRIYKGHAGMRR